MSKAVRIEIGGIGLLFRYGDSQIRKEKDSDLDIKDFIRDGKDDFIIDIEVGDIPEYPQERILFESRENWNSYIHNGSYIFEIRQNKKDVTSVCIMQKDLNKAKVYIASRLGRARHNKKPNPIPGKSWSLESFIRILGQLIFSSILHRYQGLLIHSSGVIFNGEGIIFCGVSGSGKTTLSKLWQARKNVAVLSDDRVIVRREKKDYFVYGTPWPGEGRAVSFKKAPLKKIFFLSQEKENRLTLLGEKESFRKLITQCFPAIWDRQSIDFSLRFCGELVGDLPCYSFGFTPDRSALGFIEKNL